MVSVVRAIVLSAIAQVALLAILVGYLFNHTNDTALQYAQLAERNAELRAAELVRIEHNELQVQFSNERNSMHDYINKRVDLRISQALKEIKK
ncbi:hypothetical protein C4K28_1472 [Pseudomonas chlororaphis subsp. piscium]|nr:hypothetical protein C4K28_1472 [Pseudomonas chlororaphis subsp. piscium]